MLVTRNGVIKRQPASQIRVIGRATQGVRVIALDDGDELVDIAKVAIDFDADDPELVDGDVELGGEVGEEALEAGEAGE